MTLWGLAFPVITRAQEPSKGAKDVIAAEGDAAVDRLKDAITGQKATGQVVPPGAVPQPNAEQRRRAFEALRTRATSPAMDARARAAVEAGQAGLAQERDRMAKRVGEALGLDAPDMVALARGAAPKAGSGWVPVLFASSSMPIATLRTYAGQLERVHGVIAFRGMPGGLTKVGPMAKLSAEILRIDPGCEGPGCAMRAVQLIVDPIVFRQQGVVRVPAFAMIPGDPTQPYCERQDDSERSPHIVYGDAALSGLLEEYGRLGGRQEVRDAQARLEPR
jgi:hypothetical protein